MGLSRLQSGYLWNQHFSELAPGNLDGQGGWIVDTGTWSVTAGGVVTNAGGNLIRCRNSHVFAAEMAVQIRARFPGKGTYFGSRLLVNPDTAHWTDYHSLVSMIDLQQLNAVINGVGTAIARETHALVANQWYWWTVGFGIDGTHPRQFNVWRDGVQWLGPDFNSSIGPTDAGQVGLIHYGLPGTEWSEIMVTAGVYVTVRGLGGSQGFRIFRADDTVLASSVDPNNNPHVLTTGRVDLGRVPWPFTGYLQVFQDAGTWEAPLAGVRYPEIGSASDLYGGDVYGAPPVQPTARTGPEGYWLDEHGASYRTWRR